MIRGMMVLIKLPMAWCMTRFGRPLGCSVPGHGIRAFTKPGLTRHTNPDICPGLGVTLSLPSSWFIPDETFSLTASVCNNTGETLTGYPLFVVLDVFGEYFWGPGWTTTFDNYLDELPVWEEGATDLVIIPEFAWPDGAGTASGIRFIACMTDPAITIPYGEIAVAEFGWGE